MAKNTTMIEAIREYLLQFPDLKVTSKLNVDYLPEEAIHHSISFLGTQNSGILETSIAGDTLREYLFSFSTTFLYEERLRTHFENSGFLESFVEWIECNNKHKIFPQLPGERDVQSIEVVQTPSLFLVHGSVAEYSATLRITYIERR